LIVTVCPEPKTIEPPETNFNINVLGTTVVAPEGKAFVIVRVVGVEPIAVIAAERETYETDRALR
jgi:hypothetical protein